MIQNIWFISAMGAAILWGFSYALSDKVMRQEISPLFLMVATGCIYFFMSLIISYFTGHLKAGLNILSNDKTIAFNILITAVCHVVGAFLIYYAINLKNASLVSLIEISYPLFTIIFAYILMREIQINTVTMIGGALIFIGIALIYIKG